MYIYQYTKKFANKNFIEKEFSDVDSLILCQISYQDFDNIYNNFDDETSIMELTKHVKSITKNTLYPQKNNKLLKSLQSGIRFSNIKMKYFHQVFSDKHKIQFAALTYIGDTFAYICFRGTDISITGWKEDLLFAVKDVVPSQRLALEYAQKVIPLIPAGKKIYIGGHSKGGNLAIHAACYLEEIYQKRISKVYDHDGPGFSYNIYGTEEYERIVNRVEKTIPRNSLIGILLNSSLSNAKIIKSNAITGLYQHDPLRWIIDHNGNFVIVQDRSRMSKEIQIAVDELIISLSYEEKKALIRTIGMWFDNARIKTVKQINKKFIPLLKQIRKSIKSEENVELKYRLRIVVLLFFKLTLYKNHSYLTKRADKKIEKLNDEYKAYSKNI